jgi:hypothetical protein
VAAGGWRIYKAEVSLCSGPETEETSISDKEPWETYPVETIVAAQLLELIEREGVRRFVVHCSGGNEDDGILVSNQLPL